VSLAGNQTFPEQQIRTGISEPCALESSLGIPACAVSIDRIERSRLSFDCSCVVHLPLQVVDAKFGEVDARLEGSLSKDQVARIELDQGIALVHFRTFADVDVAKIRRSMGLTREAFAMRFGLQLGTVRDWEQRKRKPDGAARVLLTVIAREPEAVTRALAAAAA